MSRTTELRNDLDDLELSHEQIAALDIECFAVHDMLGRLQQEIRAVRRELLLIDADSLLRVARNFGGLS